MTSEIIDNKSQVGFVVDAGRKREHLRAVVQKPPVHGFPDIFFQMHTGIDNFSYSTSSIGNFTVKDLKVMCDGLHKMIKYLEKNPRK